MTTPFIKIIECNEAEGRLKEIYEDLIHTRGKLADVHKIHSLNPDSLVRHMDLYMTLMFGKSPLSRAQREMIAVVVSTVNDCEYCKQHHAEALLNYWKDEERIEKIRKDFRNVGLEKKNLMFCELAERLTLHPSKVEFENTIEPMKQAGISDREILDAVLVISYFNFVNRLVLGLGVEPSPNEISGYNY